MKTYQISTKLVGITPVMFDRYSGDNTTELRAEDKMYFAEDGQSLVLPALNLMSFLSAQNTPSAPKRLIDSRKYKIVAAGMLSYVSITPWAIPLTSNNKPIKFTGWNEKIHIHKAVARLEKGIPNPKTRPVIELPWELSFQLTMIENPDVSIKMLEDIFVRGGIAIGLGTWRGLFGKFQVDKWEVK